MNGLAYINDDIYDDEEQAVNDYLKQLIGFLSSSLDENTLKKLVLSI